MKTAIILGATGLTGSVLLNRLLEDDRYSKLKLFSRRSVGFTHPKLEEHLLDLFELQRAGSQFSAEELFCCVGTTKAKTPDLDIYRKVDYGIPVEAAKLARENSIETMLVVSAMGADPDSRFFYNRIKGEMERDVNLVGVAKTYFFQPSLIGGQRKDKRTFEKLMKGVAKLADPLLIGPLEKYRSIHPETIAKTMIRIANEGYPTSVIESDEIKKIAKADPNKTK